MIRRVRVLSVENVLERIGTTRSRTSSSESARRNSSGLTSDWTCTAKEASISDIGNATSTIKDNQPITVSCAEGEKGFVYDGIAEVEIQDLALADIPKTHTAVMLNVGKARKPKLMVMPSRSATAEPADGLERPTTTARRYALNSQTHCAIARPWFGGQNGPVETRARSRPQPSPDCGLSNASHWENGQETGAFRPVGFGGAIMRD